VAKIEKVFEVEKYSRYSVYVKNKSNVSVDVTFLFSPDGEVFYKNYNIYSYIVLLEEDAIFDSSDYAFPYAKSVKVVVESYRAAAEKAHSFKGGMKGGLASFLKV